MNIVSISATKDYLSYHANFLKHYDEWSYDYIFNDIIPYWDENKFWDNFSITLAIENFTLKNLHPGKDIRGGIACVYQDNEFHVKRLFTIKEYRGKGVAKFLLEQEWKKAFSAGCRYIRMWCDNDAIPFYKKLGFNIIAYNDKNYGLVYSPIFTKSMHKTLNITKDFNPLDLLDDSVWQSKKAFEGV